MLSWRAAWCGITVSVKCSGMCLMSDSHFPFPGNRRPKKLRPCVLPFNAAHRLRMVTRVASTAAVKNSLLTAPSHYCFTIKATRVKYVATGDTICKKTPHPERGNNSRIFAKLPITWSHFMSKAYDNRRDVRVTPVYHLIRTRVHQRPYQPILLLGAEKLLLISGFSH